MYFVFTSAGREGSDFRDFLEDSCLGITPPAPSIPNTQILYSFSHKHRRKYGNFPFSGMRPFSPSPRLSLSFRSTATGSLYIGPGGASSSLIYWKHRPLRSPGSLCHLKPAHPDRSDLTLLRCSWSFAGQKKTLLYIWCIFTSKHGSDQHLPQTHLHHLQHLLRGELTRLITVENGRLWSTQELFGNKKCVVEVGVGPPLKDPVLLLTIYMYLNTLVSNKWAGVFNFNAIFKWKGKTMFDC